MPPEKGAAIVNGLVVLGLVLALTIPSQISDAHAVVYAYPVRHFFKTIATVVLALLVFTPIAALVAWRTWVHAQRALAKEGRGWRGVAEGGLLGVALAFPFVAPAIVLPFVKPRPGIPFIQPLMYAALYLLMGLVIGLLLAFVLRMTALLVLRVTTGLGVPH